jgi:hypothetical protein
MASLLESLKSAIKTSIHGRRLGLDSNDYLVGPPALRQQVEDIDASTGSSASPHGVTRSLTSGSSVTSSYTLQSPIPGVIKTLTLQSTSTGGSQFTATNATIYTASDGSSAAVVNLYAPGAAVQLLGESTSVWRVIGGSLGTTTTPLVTFTTAT